MSRTFTQFVVLAGLLACALGAAEDAACKKFKTDNALKYATACTTDNSTCPDTCKKLLDDIDAACMGKITFAEKEDDAGKKTNVEFKYELYDRLTQFAAIDVFADKACKPVIATATKAKIDTCMAAFTFTSKELMLGSCTESTDTKCTADCQTAIDMPLTMCKQGDVFTVDGETYDTAKAAPTLMAIGPKSCKYEMPKPSTSAAASSAAPVPATATSGAAASPAALLSAAFAAVLATAVFA